MKGDVDQEGRIAAPRDASCAVVRRFLNDQTGATMILFALGLSVVALAAAIALDYGRIEMERAQMQRALDAAALAAAHRIGAADEEMSAAAVATAFFKANVPVGSKLAIDKLKINPQAGEVIASSGGLVPTSLLNAFGISNVRVGAGARVVRGDSAVEVALVLDNSGSMSGQSIIDLKAAARTLVDVVFAGGGSNEKVSVGVVPFAGSVNVGAHRRDEGWIDTDGVSPVHHENFADPRARFDVFQQLGTSWQGCVEARPAPHDVTDTPPSSANPATLFVPMFAPDEPDRGNADGATYPNNYLNDFGGSCAAPEQICVSYNKRKERCDEYGPKPLSPSVAQSRMCKYDNATPPSGLGPNYGCTTSPLLELSTNKDEVIDAIDAMGANGSTNIGEGLMWGWRIVSPEAPFMRGEAWSEPKNQKFIVLMTDGENTYSRYSNNHNWTWYGAFGFGAKGRLGTTNSASSLLNRMNEKTRVACTNAKAKGVIVYTIAFRLENDANTRALLSNCASDSSKAFTASDGSVLFRIFQAIGREISQLRVAG